MVWKAEYAVILMLSTLVDFYLAQQIAIQQTKYRKRQLLIVSLILNLGLLFTFKYFNFFNDTVQQVLTHFNIFYSYPTLELILPVGISFYTFQSLAYIIDVYKGVTKPEKHLGVFAAYIVFFPQLVAGPIERSNHFLPQFYKKHEFNYGRIVSGLKLAGWGFFKKLVIADRLGVFVDSIYNNPSNANGLEIIIATFFFAFQIYCDFSGYTDIARGVARTMGYDLMLNFRSPYLSKSIKEFWSRWHISLSTWFKDYVYIPLGGNRASKFRISINLLIVFLISGIWHGASMTFVIWGALHAVYIIAETLTTDLRSKITIKPIIVNCLGFILTFSLTCFAWIFFRANNISDALHLVKQIFTLNAENLFSLSFYKESLLHNGLSIQELSIGLTGLLVLLLAEIYNFEEKFLDSISQKPLIVRWTLYYSLLFILVFWGYYSRDQLFIYFQF